MLGLALRACGALVLVALGACAGVDPAAGVQAAAAPASSSAATPASSSAAPVASTAPSAPPAVSPPADAVEPTVDDQGPLTVELSPGPVVPPGPDGDDDVGLAVWNGKLVQWGRITLPKGPFRAISGSFREGCGIRPDGHLACWGESRNVRAFATKLAGEKIAMVSVDSGKACAVTEGRALFCLERPDGTPKPNRRLVRASGSFVAVDLFGYPWAVTSAGTAMQSEIGGDFSRIEERVPGHFVTSRRRIPCSASWTRRACCVAGAGERVPPRRAVSEQQREAAGSLASRDSLGEPIDDGSVRLRRVRVEHERVPGVGDDVERLVPRQGEEG